MSSATGGQGATPVVALTTLDTVADPPHDPYAVLGGREQRSTLARLLGGRAASAAAVLLVLLSLPLQRPDIFGESLAPIGFAVVAAAAALAMLRARFTGPDPVPVRSATVPIVVCVVLAYLWLMIQAAAVNPVDPVVWFRPAAQGLVLTGGGLAALAVVCSDSRTAAALARGFVLLIAVLCASYAVTAGIWLVLGVGSGQLGTVPIHGSAEPVYVPFTTTQSAQNLSGVDYPRFTGLGREPGWMAMYCSVAYLMVDMVGLPRRSTKLLLLVGLVGTISTAGFGVFVVVWAYRTFFRDRGTGIRMTSYLRQLAGIGAVALAAWVAVAAPILGVSAKATQNETSLDERVLATQAGVRALFDHPLGGVPTEAQSGINLIADISVSGLPFIVLVCAALLLPLLWRGRDPLSAAVVLVVFLTLLTSQPAKDSTWAFGVVALACAVPAAGFRPTMHTRPGGCP